MWLLIGLGNPGSEYERSRHNIGFMLLDALARRWRVEGFRGKFGADLATGQVAGEKCVLLRPLEYMNLSGQAVGRAAGFFQVDAAHVIVLHDDIDLPLGDVRVKKGGGTGGHKGLASLVDELGESGFSRVRIGVGRPPEGLDAADYVLSPVSEEDKDQAMRAVEEAVQAALSEVTGAGSAG